MASPASKSVGKPFNADFHQAMMEIEDPSVPAGTVVQELIPGYLLAGRLLRAAMVAVSKGGPPRPHRRSQQRRLSVVSDAKAASPAAG